MPLWEGDTRDLFPARKIIVPFIPHLTCANPFQVPPPGRPVPFQQRNDAELCELCQEEPGIAESR